MSALLRFLSSGPRGRTASTRGDLRHMTAMAALIRVHRRVIRHHGGI